MAQGPAARASAVGDARIVALMAAADPAGTGAGAGDPTASTGGADSAAPSPTDAVLRPSELSASAAAAAQRTCGLGAGGNAVPAATAVGMGAGLGGCRWCSPSPCCRCGCRLGRLAVGLPPPPLSNSPGLIPFPWWARHVTHGCTICCCRVPSGPAIHRHRHHYRRWHTCSGPRCGQGRGYRSQGVGSRGGLRLRVRAHRR